MSALLTYGPCAIVILAIVLLSPDDPPAVERMRAEALERAMRAGIWRLF